MPDLLAATYALRPHNDFARSALPGAPVAAVKRPKAWTFPLSYVGALVRRTVDAII